MVPGDWDPVVRILGLSSDYSSGTVRFGFGGAPDDDYDDLEVAASYFGEFGNEHLTWSAAAVLGGVQFTQLVAWRRGDNEADDLEAAFNILVVIVSPE